MSDEPPDATPEEISNEEAIKRFEAEAAFRQSNVLPLDSAMNEGRFYGLLIRKGRPLGVAQRLGFFFIGIMLGGFAFLEICFTFPALSTALGMPRAEIAATPSFYGILWLPFDAILFAVGLWLIVTALRPRRRRGE